MEELERLIVTPGVSGFEGGIRSLIREMVGGLTPLTTDTMGNLLTTIGEGTHIMLMAHMDEIGMLVSRIEEDGTLRFRKVGGVDERCLLGRMIRISTSSGQVNGVIGVVPPHLMRDPEKEMSTFPKAEDLRVDVGCSSRKEVESLGIRLMDPMTVEKRPFLLNGRILCSRGLDDRFGCWVLIELLRRMVKRALPLRLSFAWTAQEEMGLRGAKVVGGRERVEMGIIIDTSSATDFPDAPGHATPVALGKGPVIRYMDSRAIASPPLVRLVEKVAGERGIPYQIVITGGGTDGVVIQEAGAMMIPMGVPIRYTHSPVECMHLDDLDRLIDLLEALLIALSEKGLEDLNEGRDC